MFIVLGVVFNQGCQVKNESNKWVEKQITSADYGHFLNPVQAWSPGDRWLVYDTRNIDSQIGRTGNIERVSLETNLIDTVYQTQNQTLHGPGVGAAAYSPVSEQVIFIHGLRNSDKDQPYGISRRTGVGVLFDQNRKIIHYDARDINPPFTIGALRGGTHAHSWSGDGTWISFTYNDDVMAELSLHDTTLEDLRMVGVMAPWEHVNVRDDEEQENSDGTMFSMIISRVTEDPQPGSDEISKAYEDGWIGRNGYIDTLGVRHHKAVAFLGDVRDKNGKVVTEVFVVDLPEDKPDLSTETQLKGSTTMRPQPLSMVHQQRVTYTTGRKYPGVQGPRQWMKSSPDGSLLYFMMKDDQGIVQLYTVPTVGGDFHQVTFNNFSIETSFDIDPTGRWVAYGTREKVFITSLESSETECVTPQYTDHDSQLRAIQWSHTGHYLAFNRKVFNRDSSYFQIFTLAQNGQ